LLGVMNILKKVGKKFIVRFRDGDRRIKGKHAYTG
jgi:hypothetical protein